MVRLCSTTRYTGAQFVVGEAEPPIDGRELVDMAGGTTIAVVLRECMMVGYNSKVGVKIEKVSERW
jgi:hypothetical protein